MLARVAATQTNVAAGRVDHHAAQGAGVSTVLTVLVHVITYMYLNNQDWILMMMIACRWRWMKSWKPILDRTEMMKRVKMMKMTDEKEYLSNEEYYLWKWMT